MTETPETEVSHTAAPRPYHGWQVAEETQEEDHVFNERAEARERWERRHYGWALFGVIMLLMVGVFQAINGFVALYRSGTYEVGRNGLVVDVDYTTWGWVHLGLGTLALVAALGLLGGHLWARILGVTLAALSAIAYMAFIPAFPVLCLVVITLDILVIYALTAHGGDLSETDY